MEPDAPRSEVGHSPSLPLVPLIPAENRIWFAQMLRGVAALCVVYYHLGEVFWKKNPYVSRITYLHPIQLKSAPLFLHLTGWLGHNYVEMGDVGVALFFLISGFVIPFSVNKGGPVQFLVRRCFRIYPTYLVGLVFTLLILLLNAHVSHLPFRFTLADCLANAALVFDIFPHPSIGDVNWTLIVEMRFYLLCVLIHAVSRLKSSIGLSFWAAILCLASLPAAHAPAWPPGFVTLVLFPLVSSHAPYLIFMLMGVCFHNLFQAFWSVKLFGVVLAFLLVLFYVSASTFPGAHGVLRLTRAYTVALGAFSMVYFFRDRFKPNVVLDFFAEISFPLYIIHYYAGITLLTLLYNLHPYSLLNLVETLLIIIPLSYLLHVYVEAPSNRLGHLLTKKPPGVPA